MNQENYDEDNPNLDGDYKAVLRIRKLKTQTKDSDVAKESGRNEESKIVKPHAPPSGQQLLQISPHRRSSQQTLRFALFEAAEKNDVSTVRGYLGDRGRIDRSLTDSRYRDPETGETVLNRALGRGSFRVVECLLATEHAAPLVRATYDVDVGGEVSKRTSLHQATESGNSAIIRLILAAVSDPAEQLALLRKETTYVPNGRRPRSVTCLHIAAMKGYSDIVEHFVSVCGVDVNESNEHKDTALMWASLEGHAATVDTLIRLKAEVNARNDQGSTALHYAIRHGHADVALLLLTSGRADANAQRRRGLVCPLVLAATMGYEEVVRLLLKCGADVNVRIHGSETALHYAAGEGHLGVCQTLISEGIDLDAPDSRGETPLIEAASHGEIELVKYLLAQGANINHVTLDKRSVWTYAVDAVDDSMLHVLLAHVSQTMSDENGVVVGEGLGSGGATAASSMLSMRLGWRIQLPVDVLPLHMAAMRGDDHKLRLMLASQLHPEAHDARGNTFVHVAAAANRWQILNEFALGRLASAPNDEGNTPLHEACRLGHTDAVRVLLAKSRLRERNKSDRTALHEAARSIEGDSRERATIIRMVMLQIQQGHYWELLDAQDERGYTALHWAAKNGNRPAVHELRSLSLRVQDEDGNTPLHVAAAAGDADTFSELIRMQQAQRRDELEIANTSGMTPLRLAVYHNSTAILEECIRVGADLIAVGQDGQTLLHWVADLMKTDESMVKIYMQAVRVISDLAVFWWTTKTKRPTPSHTTVAYEELRRKALKTLFGAVQDNNGYTVLQYSAKICCAPMIEHALSLKNVYKFKIGNFLEYDVTDLTPDTLVLQSAKKTNKVYPVPLVSVHADKPAKFQDSEKIGADGKKSLSLETRPYYPEEENTQPPLSLIELIVSNEEPLSAATVFGIQPIADMVRSYWSTYQWLYAACMLMHLGYMVLLTAYAPELQKAVRQGFNMTALVNSPEATVNCTSTQSPTFTHYILISEPIILLLIQFLQLLSLAWRKKRTNSAGKAARSKNCCSSSSSNPTAIVGPAILRACGTVFALATIAWLVMFSFCVVNQDYMLAVAILFGWIFPLNFTSGFEALHQFSLMLRHMIFEDIIRFLTVYAFVLCGFGFAQHVVVGAFDEYSDYKIQDTLFSTMQWLVGMNNFWDRPPYSNDGLYNRYGFLAALYICYTVMSTIILINLLIAMMSDSYTGVKNHSAMLWKVASIELALDTQRSLSPLKPLLTCLRDYLDSVDKRALRFDKKRLRWYLRVNKAKRVGPKKKGLVDVDPAIVQLSQKVSAIQEQLDSMGGSLKQLLPKVAEDVSTQKALWRQADTAAKTAWKKAVDRVTITSS